MKLVSRLQINDRTPLFGAASRRGGPPRGPWEEYRDRSIFHRAVEGGKRKINAALSRVGSVSEHNING